MKVVRSLYFGKGRKWLLLSLIFFWSLASFFHLKNLYNPSVIQLEMRRVTSASKVEKIIRGAGVADVTIHYERPNETGTLIMTTGGDAIMGHVAMREGYQLMPGERYRAVIGDQLSIREFGILQSVGREIEVSGTWYRIAGVMKDSHDVMIAYEEDLLNGGWHTMTVRYVPPEGSRQRIIIRDVERALALNDLHYNRRLHHETHMNSYLNAGLLSILLMLFLGIIRLWEHFRKQMSAVLGLWKAKRNTTHGLVFIAHEKRLLGYASGLFFASAGGLLAGTWLAKQLRLPDGFLPDNLFSPGSWMVKFGHLWNFGNALIENGIRGIYRTGLFSWFLLAGITLILLLKWAVLTNEVE